MALGIVSDEVFNQEVEKYLEGTVVQPSSNPKGAGRKPGSNDVPESLQKLLGDTKLESGKAAARELAVGLGLGPRQADVYALGKNGLGSNDPIVPGLAAHIEKTKERIARKAGALTEKAIDNLTEDKLAGASVAELATVMRSAAAVVKEMEPPVQAGPSNTQNVQIVLHAPRMLDEKNLEVIDVVSTPDE